MTSEAVSNVRFRLKRLVGSITTSSRIRTLKVLSVVSPVAQTTAGRTVTVPPKAPRVTTVPALVIWNVLAVTLVTR